MTKDKSIEELVNQLRPIFNKDLRQRRKELNILLKKELKLLRKRLIRISEDDISKASFIIDKIHSELNKYTLSIDPIDDLFPGIYDEITGTESKTNFTSYQIKRVYIRNQDSNGNIILKNTPTQEISIIGHTPYNPYERDEAIVLFEFSGELTIPYKNDVCLDIRINGAISGSNASAGRIISKESNIDLKILSPVRIKPFARQVSYEYGFFKEDDYLVPSNTDPDKYLLLKAGSNNSILLKNNILD